jgi:hypothetical protein
VVDSVQRTLDGASRLEITSVVRGELTRSATLHGRAAVDLRTHRIRLSLAFTKLPPPGDPGADSIKLPSRVEVVIDGPTVYVHAPGLGDLVGADTPWVRATSGKLDSSIAELVEGRWAPYQPSWIVESLRGVTGDLDEIGAQTLDGAPTTHYRATLDARRAVEESTAIDRTHVAMAMDELRRSFGVVSFPVDIWVGEDGLIRQMRYALVVPNGGSARSRASVSWTVQVSRFGGAAAVSLPEPGRVTDVTDRSPAAG